MEASVLFIKTLTGVDATTDIAWPFLRDMQKIRNIIVHRGGARGETPEHQKEFDELAARYSGDDFRQEKNLLFGTEELWASIQLCDKFASEAEGFFRLLFRNLGPP